MRPTVALPLLAVLLAANLPAEAAARCEAAEVPCGYIYPRLFLEADWPSAPPPLPARGLVVKAILAYEFDSMSEGLALDQPGSPIVVTFDFPKKPPWAAVAVEPPEITIPITPQYFRPDPSDPANPGLTYRYETEVTITFGLAGTPTLLRGEEHARLLVFAQSTASGLYKEAYGIREFKVRPEGAVVVDAPTGRDLAPVDARAVPLPDLAIPLAPGVAARLDLADSMEYFRTTRVAVALEGATAPLAVALLDATGHALALAGPAVPPFAFNVTFPRAGEYRFVAVLPGDLGPAAGAATLRLPGPGEGAAHRMPRDYRLLVEGAFTQLAANAADPAAQDERLVPFPVFAGALGAELALAVETPGVAADRGASNVNLEILDPTGAVLAAGTVDPLNPAKRFPVGALPGPGLYAARVFGAGAASAWRLAVQVVYEEKPLLLPSDAPWRGDVARLGRFNATLAIDAPEPWIPAGASVAAFRADGSPVAGAARAAYLVLDERGALVTSTGLREADAGALGAALTFPAPGRYLALAWAESARGSPAQFGRGLVARDLVVGDPAVATITYPAAFEGEAAGLVAPGGSARIGAWRVPVREGAGEIAVPVATDALADVTILLLDAGGGEVARETLAGLLPGSARPTLPAPSPGDYTLVVAAAARSGASLVAGIEVAHAGPVTAANPLHVPPAPAPASGFRVPAPLLATLAAGLVAALALRRP